MSEGKRHRVWEEANVAESHALLEETTLGLAEAARSLPAGRKGRRPHLSTLLRWILEGVRGPRGERVRLEGLRLGSRWITSKEALQPCSRHSVLRHRAWMARGRRYQCGRQPSGSAAVSEQPRNWKSSASNNHRGDETPSNKPLSKSFLRGCNDAADLAGSAAD